MSTPPATLMYPKNGTVYLIQENSRKDAHIFDLLDVIAKLESENAVLKAEVEALKAPPPPVEPPPA